MQFINHKWQRYLVLLPLIYLAISAFIYNDMTRRIDSALLLQKYQSVVHDVDVLAAAVDQFVILDKDWEIYDYARPISAGIEYIDDLYQVFAAVYSQHGGNLFLISNRFDEKDAFDPRNYAEFTETVSRNESGEMRFIFSPQSEKPREMRLYFKWIPTSSELSGRYLVAAAVSLKSIVVPMARDVTNAQLVNIFITFLISAVMVYLIARLGYIYDRRGGKSKWRGDKGGGQDYEP